MKGKTVVKKVKVKMNTYRCVHCGWTDIRESSKAWIASYCGRVNKTVHLVLVKPKKAKSK